MQCILVIVGFLPFEQKGITQPFFSVLSAHKRHFQITCVFLLTAHFHARAIFPVKYFLNNTNPYNPNSFLLFFMINFMSYLLYIYFIKAHQFHRGSWEENTINHKNYYIITKVFFCLAIFGTTLNKYFVPYFVHFMWDGVLIHATCCLLLKYFFTPLLTVRSYLQLISRAVRRLKKLI